MFFSYLNSESGKVEYQQMATRNPTVMYTGRAKSIAVGHVKRHDMRERCSRDAG
jgi:hypothetical protein